jgi:RNA polymerase sigma-70 factor (ECF subfamily)
MTADELTDLLRRHAGLIRKVAHAYCRDPAERDDVVQEIAVQLWRYRDRYDSRFAQTTWIYRVALNVAISHFRRTERHRHNVEMVEVPADPPDPALADLWRLLGALDAMERALVILYLDGNSHPTIGEVLGISASNVGTKLDRIKTRLRAAASTQLDQGGKRGAR